MTQRMISELVFAVENQCREGEGVFLTYQQDAAGVWHWTAELTRGGVLLALARAKTIREALDALLDDPRLR